MPPDSLRHSSLTQSSTDEFKSPIRSSEKSSQDGAKNPTADDQHVEALRIKNFLSRASETTDAIAARLIKIKAADNPLLTAAQPLVLTLARLPDLELDAETVPALRALLVREIETFQQLCTQVNLPRDHVISASYALCTALDEAANGTSWGGGSGGLVTSSAATMTAQSSVTTSSATGIDDDGLTAETQTTTSRSAVDSGLGVWAGQMLAAAFHGNTEGGTKVFLLIGRLMTHKPEGHIDLLELLYQIISVGFQGQYRTASNGRREHETIRQRLYSTISQARSTVPRELSPHWRGAGAGKFKLLHSIPVWVTASVLSLAAFGLFAWHKYELLQQTEMLVADITAVGKMTPPPVVVAPLRLAILLKDEIALGKVTVTEDARHSQVVFQGDDMFVPGQATLNPKIAPLLQKVATEIARVSGAVQVIGHSDNQPIRTRRFPNNQVLSEERASVVADALQANGVATARMEIRGQGDTHPVADNSSVAGRAKNRRVEIDVDATSAGAARNVVTVTATP